jgi:hypothetical protein
MVLEDINTILTHLRVRNKNLSISKVHTGNDWIRANKKSVKKQVFTLDFKLLPCCECCSLTFGWFPSIWSCQCFGTLCSIFIGSISRKKFFLLILPMKMAQTECSKTLAYEIQVPGNHSNIRIQSIYPQVYKKHAWGGVVVKVLRY